MSAPPLSAADAPNTEQVRWFTHEIYPHDSSLKSYLQSSFPSASVHVDDVVQESYLRIWRVRTTRPVESAKALLFKIARNLTLDILRHHSAAPITVVGDLNAVAVLDERTGAADAACLNDKIRILAEGLATLPPRGREVVMLRKLKGLTQKETAAHLSISEKTVDEHLYRGMKRLGKYLRHRGVCSYFE